LIGWRKPGIGPKLRGAKEREREDWKWEEGFSHSIATEISKIPKKKSQRRGKREKEAGQGVLTQNIASSSRRGDGPVGKYQPQEKKRGEREEKKKRNTGSDCSGKVFASDVGSKNPETELKRGRKGKKN